MQLIFSIFLIAFTATASAHNNVVVIPLAGDDPPPSLPPAPVAKVDPNQSDYIIMASTVADNITDLEWQRIDDNVVRTWIEALTYCGNLELTGRTDWRLPTVTELLSIVDYGSLNPSIDEVVFPGTGIHPLFSSGYWSSAVGGRNINPTAPAVDFASGSVVILPFIIGSGIFSSPVTLFVRCVR